MILQTGAGAVECIVDRKRKIGMPLVGARTAVDIDFAAIGQRKRMCTRKIPPSRWCLLGAVT